jgi:DNA polymerase I
MPDLCLTQAEYSFHNNQPIIHLFGRDSSGNTHCVDVVGFKPYFFIPSNESSKVLPPAELDPNEYFSIRHEPLSKVIVQKPSDVFDLRDKFSKHYEADILYTLRF